MSPVPWVFPSLSLWTCCCLCAWDVLASDVSIVSVSLAGASVSRVLTCSDASCSFWHPLKSPPPLPPPNTHTHKHTHTHTHTQTHTHTHTRTHTHKHTNTSTISQNKPGFSDFLQILLKIRGNHLKTAQTETSIKKSRFRSLRKITTHTKARAARLSSVDGMIGLSIIL